jgi:hypothetical protein
MITLEQWIEKLREQFDKEDLQQTVLKAHITLGLLEKDKKIQYHTLKYTSKDSYIKNKR